MVSRRRFLCAAVAAGATLPGTVGRLSAGARDEDFLAGVNVAGAEFGSTMPGVFGTDYIYPERSQLATYKALGFNIVRLPFRWERLQPEIGQAFSQAEWLRLDATLAAARGLDLYVILDVHNYARRRVGGDGFRDDHLIGSTLVPKAGFEAFSAELARRTGKNPKVIFGLMNEPHGIAAAAWFEIAQGAVNAIRGTGAGNLILVPGTAWTGAHSWLDSGNDVLAKLSDPKGNWALEVHQYLDSDSSGTKPVVVSRTIGSERLRPFQAWARRHKLRAFLGEFGSGGDADSLAAVGNMLDEVQRNLDVWIGWTAWAAGPWWPKDDPFALEPLADGQLPPQMQLLAERARMSTRR